MIKSNNDYKVILCICLLVFLSFAFYILYLNQEVFYTVHGRSEFFVGTPFYNTLLSHPFGIIQYVGAWLTQFFYYPLLGSALLVALWVLIFIVGIKAFHLQGGAISLMLLPVACLLTSVVDLGYWVYTCPIRGYWFSQSVAYLILLLLLCVANLTSRRWHLIWYIAAITLYPALGWYSLLFVLCLAVSQRPGWPELFGVVMLLFTANIWRALLYSHLCLDDVLLAGFPRFISASDYTPRLSVPFWILGAVTLTIPLCARYLSHRYVPLVTACLGILFTTSFMFHDKNYIDEMRMVRNAESDNWSEVLNIANQNPKPTASMVMLKNVALTHEGGLLERSFKIGNKSYPINNPDSLHVSFLEIASPIVYYNYGMMNEAIRLNYECAVQAGFSPFYLKMLSRCAHATGETELGNRFISLLHHHPFYSHWQSAPAPEIVKEIQNSYDDELTGVENSDSYIVNNISFWYTTDDKVCSELALFYSMLRCDSRRFWRSLRKYIKLHQGENFPLHAQEAYIMYLDKSPEEKRMMLPVEQNIYDHYNLFWKDLESHLKINSNLLQVGEEMREQWGETYWYYNIFGRKIYE